MISRTQLEIRVQYSAPIVASRRVLRVLPLRRAGQIVRREVVAISPSASSRHALDEFGNRLLVIEHRGIEREFGFRLELEVETDDTAVPDARPDFVTWKMPSRAVYFEAELQNVARAVRQMPVLERAAHFGRFCFLKLEYDARTDEHPRSSSEIWRCKRGNCADFAHVFLSLCRGGGILARYVAGFNHSRGQMHAWAEVWSEGCWHPFDPTLGRPMKVGVAVAVGRDFYDCAPHQGRFQSAIAVGSEAQLTLRCRTRSDIPNDARSNARSDSEE